MHPSPPQLCVGLSPGLMQVCPRVISEEFPLAILGKQPRWHLLYPGIILNRVEPREEGEVVGGEM